MLITKKSPFTGKINTLEINVTPEQLDNYYQSSEVIQRALFWLTPDEREFIMTGITPDEFPEPPPEDDTEEWVYWEGDEDFVPPFELGR